MDELKSKTILIDRVRIAEGSTFECDEEAILKEYQKKEENTSSIAIKILSIFGGFLAAIVFLGFLLVSGLYESKTGLILFGIVFIASSIWINKKYDHLIIDTFSVTTYVTGCCLLAFGLFEMNVDENSIVLLISIIAFISLFFTQNYMLVFIAMLTISCCFLFLIISNSDFIAIQLYIPITAVLLTYVFFNEATLIRSNIKISKLYNPGRIALLISFLLGLITIGKRGFIFTYQVYMWFSSLVLFFIIIYLVHTIIKITEITNYKNKVLIYTLSSAVLVPTLFSPSIAGAIIIILLSFLVNYKTGLAIGIISFVYFIAQYYYDLNFTLLIKSILLFSSGIIFLLFYVFITKKLVTNEKI